jgi:hypothetical protein
MWAVSIWPPAFDNSAVIGASSLAGNAVVLSTAKGFAFTNSGTILNSGSLSRRVLGGNTTGSSTITNSGTITGGIYAAITGAAGTQMSMPIPGRSPAIPKAITRSIRTPSPTS